MPKKILNIAHRGASGHAPENTMTAFRKAYEMGADAIELDLRQTSDGRLVVLHGPRLKRTTGDHRLVGQVRFAEIKTLNAGSRWGKAYRNERIPTLEEVLEFARHRIPLQIELKQGSSSYPMIENQLVHLIKAFKAHSWVTVSSRDTKALQALREGDPQLRLGLLTRLTDAKPILHLAQKVSAESIHIRTWRFRSHLLRQAHDQGFDVYVYVINRPSVMKYYARLGVDGLFTNYPDRLTSLLNSLRQNSERMRA